MKQDTDTSYIIKITYRILLCPCRNSAKKTTLQKKKLIYVNEKERGGEKRSTQKKDLKRRGSKKRVKGREGKRRERGVQQGRENGS